MSLGSWGLSAVFSSWGRLIGRVPEVIVGAACLLTTVLIGQTVHLGFDTSFESFLDEDHSTRLTLDRFREEFGRGDPIVVAVRIPGRLADPGFLTDLAALHRDLEDRVLTLDRITSLINVRATQARGNDLRVGELLEDWPSDKASLEAFEHFVLTTPLYANYLIGIGVESAIPPLGSASSTERRTPGWTAIVLEPETYAAQSTDDVEGFGEDPAFVSGAEKARRLDSDDDAQMIASVREVLAKHRAAGLEIELAGGLVVGEVVTRTIRSDFARLLLYAVSVISVLLWVVFRRVAVVAVILSVVLLSLGGCLGMMALTHIAVGFGTQILPAFLLAAGVGYAVHIVTLFRYYLLDPSDGEAARSRLDSGPLPASGDRERRRYAAERALEHGGPPIVLTALTTMGGLFSFVPAELAPLSELGIVAPVGIALAAAYSLILLPALLVVLPLTLCDSARAARSRSVDRWVGRVGLCAIAHRVPVLLGVFVTLVAAGIGIVRLETSHNPLEWLPPDSAVRRATELVDAELGGASVLELMIDSDDPGGFQTPKILSQMHRVEQEILSMDAGRIDVGKVAGLHGVVQELNQALHADNPAEYRIPPDSKLVVQELLLFENSGMDDVEQLVDSSYSIARMSVRLNYTDAFDSIPFADRVHELAQGHLAGFANVEPTGLFMLKNAVFVGVIETTKTSFVIAIIVVGLLMIVLIGDLRIGVMSLIPNMTPIVIALGMMGFLGIPIGVYTLLVGSIALGLAVDDTIHMAHSFLRFERQGHSPTEAIRRTLSTAGVAVLFTSGALISGFLVFGLATLSALFHFGMVTAVAIVAALIADLVVSPVLFVWVAERRIARPSRKRVDRCDNRVPGHWAHGDPVEFAMTEYSRKSRSDVVLGR